MGCSVPNEALFKEPGDLLELKDYWMYVLEVFRPKSILDPPTRPAAAAIESVTDILELSFLQ